MSETSTPAQRYAPARRPGLSGGRIALIVIGAILTLLGLGLLAGGAALAAAAHSRDSAGFVTGGPARVDSDAYAVTVPDIGIDVRGPDEAYARGLLGTVRIRATSADPARPVFVGIGPTRDVDAYLDGVGHADVRDFDVDPIRVDYTQNAGGPPRSPPGEQTFWAISDTGSGTRTMTWDLETGDWTVVVMNADGSPGVHADLDLGGKLPVLRGATIGLFVAGGLVLIAGVLLIVLPLTTRPRNQVR